MVERGFTRQQKEVQQCYEKWFHNVTNGGSVMLKIFEYARRIGSAFNLKGRKYEWESIVEGLGVRRVKKKDR